MIQRALCADAASLCADLQIPVEQERAIIFYKM